MLSLGYTVPIENLDLTNAVQDVLVLNPARSIMVTELRLWSNVTTDVFARLSWLKRSTAGSGGGSAITPNALDDLNTRAAGFTATPMVTTPGTPVANSNRKPVLWNMRYPLELVYVPGAQPKITDALEFLALALLAADLTSTRKVSGWVDVQEF